MLLRSCLSAQREDLLESFRAIVNALGPSGDAVLDLVGSAPEAPLTAWRSQSRSRLQQLISEELPDETPRRYASAPSLRRTEFSTLLRICRFTIFGLSWRR
jgi:hypothetical protein